LTLRKDPACPICGETRSIHDLIDYDAFCGVGAVDHSATEIDARALAEVLADANAGKAPLQLLDVREPHEWEIAHIEGATLVPVGELPARLAELDPAEPIVTYCHRGVRSQRAREILAAAGFSGVRSLAGGIDAWAEAVERAMPRY